MAENGYSGPAQAAEFMTISVVKLTVFGMQYVKSINLRKAVTDYLTSSGSTSG